MMLNLKTKYWFYEKTNRFVVFFFRHDPEAKNYVQKPKAFRDDQSVNIEDEPTDIYLSDQEQNDQENAAFALVVYLSLFFSLLFNYIYNIFLQEVITDACDFAIRFFDRLQIDIHVIRYLQLALFEDRLKPHTGPKDFDKGVIFDLCFLVFIICPLFVLALRFWTAPVYLNYSLRINSFVAPLSLPVIFLATHWDIVFLALLVFYLNLFVFWYHVDPPQNIYQMSKHRIRSQKVARHVFEQQERRAALHSGSQNWSAIRRK